MTTTLKQTNNIKNGLVGSTVTFPGPTPTGISTTPIPPLAMGQVYTTNGTAGQFLTSGSNGTTWATGTNSINNNPAITIKGTNPAELEVKGRMVINGRDLEDRLDTIEKVLQIPERDAKLEKKHPKLKKLYDEYITALGKYRTFESIKGDE
jgi:hypothetical protein